MRQRADFPDDVVDELVGDVLVDAERAEADADAGVEIGRLAVAVQLGVRRQRGVGVAGHVDLGHDGDVAVGCVLDELRERLLRVEAASGAAHGRAAAVFRQVRPGLDLDAPALIVGEMQVQAIDLVHRDQVDVPLHVVRTEEVARHVEHRAAPREPRTIDDPSRGHGDRAALARRRRGMLDDDRQELPQRLHAVEEPGGAVRSDVDAFGGDRELVALVAGIGQRSQRDLDDAGRGRGGRIDAGRRRRRSGADQRCQVVGNTLDVVIAGLRGDDGISGEREHAG